QGNAAFKAGDFADAVGHYSAAMRADARNPTFPLNRAAAYLRLGKNEDAERDCGAVLSLDPRSVKALFRRAQARAALQKLTDAQAGAFRLSPTPAKSPMTLFAFTRRWDAQKTAEDRWALLNEIPPAALPALFQASLESAMLAGLLATFRDVLVRGVAQPVQVRAYLLSVARVPRFSTVVLFMGREERAVIGEVWGLVGDAVAEEERERRAWGVS
ncbi:hypothetical protein BKA93DRAFT_741186, partial [Sparassis latifolia]